MYIPLNLKEKVDYGQLENSKEERISQCTGFHHGSQRNPVMVIFGKRRGTDFLDVVEVSVLIFQISLKQHQISRDCV